MPLRALRALRALRPAAIFIVTFNDESYEK